MRSRPPADATGADVARRRLDALIAELAELRGEPPPAVPSEGSSAAAVGGPARADASARGRHARRPLDRRSRITGWAGDRLPPVLQGRAHLGSAQFGLVALVVAAGLVVGAWWLVRAGGSSDGAGEMAPPRPVIAPASAVPSPSPSSPLPDSGSSSAEPVSAGQQIVVDVVGKVRDPGIAVLPVGARVVDAVRAAGGMRPGVDASTVNLARLLTDGEQVAIGMTGVPSDPGVPGGSAVSTSGEPSPGGALVNLNTADQAALETLPGVGPVTAAAILEWRGEHGGFTSVEELLEVSGIGDATLAEIAPHVTL